MNALSTLGLRAASTSFSSTEGLVKVAGRTTLFTAPLGPKGLLFKRISSLQEAVSVGGLYIYDIANPNKWCFLAGTSLIEAISRRRIGKRAAILKTENGAPIYDLFERRTWNGHETVMGKTQGWMTERIPVRRGLWLGGDVYARCFLDDHFADTANVGVVGVVTAATEGAGFSAWGPAVVRSYMATHVPMAVPFSKYLSDIKASQIALVPAKLRGYYEEVFADTIANYASKDSRPTIAITTVWNGTDEVPPERWIPPVNTATGAENSLFGSESIPYNYRTIVGGLVPAGANPLDRLYRLTFKEAGTPFDTVTQQDSPMKYRSMLRAGHRCSILGPYSGVVLFGEQLTSQPMALQTGLVGKLQVGFLRDFHVLGRSLVGGERYALAEPSHANVAELVTETLDDGTSVETPDGVNQDTTSEELEQMADYALNGEKVGEPCIYQRGTLVKYITEFNDLWDKNARARARAST